MTMRAITAIFLLLCVSCGSSGTPAAEHPEVASNDPSASPAGKKSKGRSLARPLRARQTRVRAAARLGAAPV